MVKQVITCKHACSLTPTSLHWAILPFIQASSPAILNQQVCYLSSKPRWSFLNQYYTIPEGIVQKALSNIMSDPKLWVWVAYSCYIKVHFLNVQTYGVKELCLYGLYCCITNTVSQYNIITKGIVQRPAFNIMSDLKLWVWFSCSKLSKFSMNV